MTMYFSTRLSEYDNIKIAAQEYEEERNKKHNSDDYQTYKAKMTSLAQQIYTQFPGNGRVDPRLIYKQLKLHLRAQKSTFTLSSDQENIFRELVVLHENVNSPEYTKIKEAFKRLVFGFSNHDQSLNSCHPIIREKIFHWQISCR